MIAVHSEFELACFQRILDSWSELIDAPFEFSLLFSTTLGKVPVTKFPHQTIAWVDRPGLSSQANVSLEWARVARFIRDNLECDCWFWWEWDVYPVRRDCFSFFLEKWTPSTQIMGYRHKDRFYAMKGKVNGASFYSRDFISHLDAELISQGTNFDVVRTYSEEEVARGVAIPLNDWYCMTQTEGKTVISPETRLVHGEKSADFWDKVLERPPRRSLRSYTTSERLRRFRLRIRLVFLEILYCGRCVRGRLRALGLIK